MDISIAIDLEDNVYVADTINHRIQKFDSNGNLIAKWGSQGAGDAQFNVIGGISIDPKTNNVYVIDSYNYRIQVFAPSSVTIS